METMEETVEEGREGEGRWDDEGGGVWMSELAPKSLARSIRWRRERKDAMSDAYRLVRNCMYT